METKKSKPKKNLFIGIGILVFLVLILIIYLFNSQKSQKISSKAAGSPTYDLLTPTPPITRNSQVTFTVTINTQGSPVTNAEIWLTYQSQYLTLVSVTPSTNNEFPQVIHTVSGELIHITGANTSGFNGTGTFALVTFSIGDVSPPAGGASLCSVVTPTSAATATVPPSSNPTATRTPTPNPSATRTPTPIPTATRTPTPIPTSTPVPTNTPTPTATPTATPTPLPTNTPTPLPTSTPIPTAIPPTYPIAQNTAVPPTAMPRAGVNDIAKPASIMSVVLIFAGIALKLIL